MEYKTMTLAQCAAFDHAQGLKYFITEWGKICKERAEKGISRKARIRMNREKTEVK